MSKKIIILTIPGIGSKKKGFSKAFEKDVRKFSKGTPLENNVKVLEALPFNEPQIDQNQDDLFDRLDKENKLGGPLSARKFVMQAFGDGVTFEQDASNVNSSYRNIHNYLKTEFEKANQVLLEEEGSILVIVAASMGVYLLSTYILDADNSKGIFVTNHANDDNNLENLRYLATIGCNIPLFVSGLAERDIHAFKKRNTGFEWDNYYDKDDVLGWPLEQLSKSYGNLLKDHQINTGQYVGSHVKYWDDNNFTKPFSEKLEKIYKQ